MSRSFRLLKILFVILRTLNSSSTPDRPSIPSLVWQVVGRSCDWSKLPEELTTSLL